jgi:hypothetical protein
MSVAFVKINHNFRSSIDTMLLFMVDAVAFLTPLTMCCICQNMTIALLEWYHYYDTTNHGYGRISRPLTMCLRCQNKP